PPAEVAEISLLSSAIGFPLFGSCTRPPEEEAGEPTPMGPFTDPDFLGSFLSEPGLGDFGYLLSWSIVIVHFFDLSGSIRSAGLGTFSTCLGACLAMIMIVLGTFLGTSLAYFDTIIYKSLNIAVIG